MESLPPLRVRSLDQNDPGSFTSGVVSDQGAPPAGNRGSVANNLPSLTKGSKQKMRRSDEAPLLSGFHLTETLDLSDEQRRSTLRVKQDVRLFLAS